MSRLSRSSFRPSARRTHLFSPIATPLKAMPYSVSAGEPALGSVPDSAAEKPHHIKSKDGTTTRFQNPHPSSHKTWNEYTMPLILMK